MSPVWHLCLHPLVCAQSSCPLPPGSSLTACSAHTVKALRQLSLNSGHGRLQLRLGTRLSCRAHSCSYSPGEHGAMRLLVRVLLLLHVLLVLAALQHLLLVLCASDVPRLT